MVRPLTLLKLMLSSDIRPILAVSMAIETIIAGFIGPAKSIRTVIADNGASGGSESPLKGQVSRGQPGRHAYTACHPQTRQCVNVV